jgi:phenylacetate-coenzyme A ligase PaaK-like adenylate-forming protein
VRRARTSTRRGSSGSTRSCATPGRARAITTTCCRRPRAPSTSHATRGSRRHALQRHLEGQNRRSPLHGEFRILRTSGSSGRPGLFAYDAAGWAAYVAQFLRATALADTALWEHPGLDVAVVSAIDPTHAGAQLATTCAALGLARIRPLPVTLPLEQIVTELNANPPEVLHAYASYAALLAGEQLAGRLHISPRLVTTSSELLTEAMARTVESAFGVRPFDFYATTEGLWAAQCSQHDGLHIFEDCCIVENVDARGRFVPSGTPGARLLITNLTNRALPLIRYELPDAATVDPEPCACGRTLTRLRSVHGRTDDVLLLRGVTVHPLQFAALASDPAVREFQVVQHGDRLTLRIVPAGGADVAVVRARLAERIASGLRRLGVSEPHLTTEACEAIERPPSGKLQLVVADPR